MNAKQELVLRKSSRILARLENLYSNDTNVRKYPTI